MKNWWIRLGDALPISVNSGFADFLVGFWEVGGSVLEVDLRRTKLCFGLQKASDDVRLLQKASDDVRWLQMTSDDVRWLQMTSDDVRLLQKASDDVRWLQKASDDTLRFIMEHAFRILKFDLKSIQNRLVAQ
ncbi:unnamed protein product [Caenorhabditis auriculariae]|uniref:Uncharacterized protein n=1 Tax=Caenorhabditis auriculariae TaxID=2777116 RepID=A0A8S1HTX0_9PELO|nr:unnamed protein product [Caenorhabditis auriculariae]